MGKVIASQFLSLAIFLVLWHVIASVGLFPEDLFPGPLAVFSALSELISNGELLLHLGSSLFRVLLGFIIASLLAIPLGLFLGWYARL